MEKIENRINSNPDFVGEQPRIRDTRIRVADILELISNQYSFSQIIDELPDLEKEDIIAALKFAEKRTEYAILS